MSDGRTISDLERDLQQARQRVTDAANAIPPVSAEQLLELQKNAHRARVKLEEAKSRGSLP
jgi:hypothetical protein